MSLIAVFFFCIIAGGTGADFKLSDSKLLLPYLSLNAVNYTLRGSDGACYDWSSATPEVATVTPIVDTDSECSKSAVVTAVWQSPHRAVTTVHARVLTTGHIVKCDVIVDNIHRIDIETTTQELYLHNTPESLVVIGFDEFGNTFSSLDGVPFDWRIHGDRHSGAGDGHSVLRFLTWKESEYVTPPGIAKLEDKGLQGYMQLVSGLRTGSAVVGVSLPETAYSSVKPSQVRLLVMANAQLSPALAYLIPNARLRLRVHVVQQGSDQEIRMPSAQYHLQVNDSNLVSLDVEDGCTVTAKRFGQTQITLLDRNVEEALGNLRSALHDDISNDPDLRLPRRRLPTSLIHVVEPAYLGFSLAQFTNSEICRQAAALNANLTSAKMTPTDSSKAGRDWIMEVGKLYAFSVDLYDQNSHRIYPTDNVRIGLTTPEDKIRIIEASENGTYFILKPIQHGPLTIQARLRHVLDANGAVVQVGTLVEGSQQVTVYPSVRIYPPRIILPWPLEDNAELWRSNDGFQLQATGGSGSLTWVALPSQNDLSVRAAVKRISPSRVVTVTPMGKVSAQTFGEATIVAFSSSHPQLCGAASVFVTSPASIRFVSGPAEVVIPDEPFDSLSASSETLSALYNSGASSSAIILPVDIAVLDAQGRSMTDCRRLNIVVQPLDDSIVNVLPDRLAPPFIETLNSTPVVPQACIRVLITGSQVGFTELKATLDLVPKRTYNSTSETKDSGKSGAALTSHFSVAVYQPIKFLDPDSSKAYIAIGSTRTILFVHGPRPWPLSPTSYFTRVAILETSTRGNGDAPAVVREPTPWQSSTSEGKTDVINNRAGHLSILATDRRLRPMIFSVRCGQEGVYEFVLQVGNRPSSLNPAPLVMSANFIIGCNQVDRLRLVPYRPTMSLPDGVPPCPWLNASVPEPSDLIAVPNTIPLIIGIAFYNSEGIELDAVDSFSMAVLIGDTTSAHDFRASSIVLNTKPTVRIPSDPTLSLLGQSTRPFFVVEPHSPGSSSGLLTVHVEAHSKFRLSKLHGSSQDCNLTIRLDPVAKLLPGDHLHVLHHPQVDTTFSVVGGSGHFYLSSPSHLKLAPIQSSSSAPTSAEGIPFFSYQVLSTRTGEAEIRVLDRCFPSVGKVISGQLEPVELTLTVDIVGLSTLRLHSANRIPLGGQTFVLLQAIDSRGERLPQTLSQLLKIRVHQSSKSTDVGKSHILGLPEGGSITPSHWINSPSASKTSQARFLVKGLNLGMTQLIASTNSFSHSSFDPVIIRSNVIDVQVFAPLSLSPCKFNLLVGAEYEIRASDGPQPALIEFSIDPELEGSKRMSVVRVVKNSVLVRAGTVPGRVNIRARAVSLSSRANVSEWGTEFEDSPVSSDTSCSVNVVTLSSIRIGCPLTNMLENARTLTSNQAKRLSEDERFLITCRSDESDRGCGVAPLWVEGITNTATADRGTWSLRAALTGNNIEPNQTTNNLVSPLSMSGVQPPLRFIWQLDPPQPTSPARLTHVLERFNLDQPGIHSSAGMMLIGQTPGRVTVHLTVEVTDQSAGQLIEANGRSVQRLHTQMTVIILPRLGLSVPTIPTPHQLLMSRNSRFRLKPWNDVLSNSHVHYEVLRGPQYSFNKTSDDGELRISADGIIQAHTCRVLRDGLDECGTLIKLTSWPKERSFMDRLLHAYDKPISQTMFVDVLIKEPRYLLAIPVPGDYLSASGLPVGGPYRFSVTYHDEFGRTFDAVSDEYTHVNIDLNRIDVFDAQFGPPSVPLSNPSTDSLDRATPTSGVPTANFDCMDSVLAIRALPNSTGARDRQSRLNVPTVIRLSKSESATSFSALYISLVAGGELEVLKSNSLFVSQWACLPNLRGEGIWSSSNAAILWVDPRNCLILARRPGRAYLLYSPKHLNDWSLFSNLSTPAIPEYLSSQLTYLITAEVLPLLSDRKPAIQLVYASTEDTAAETDPAVFPIISHPSISGAGVTSGILRLPVRLPNQASEKTGDPPYCTAKLDESRRSLAAMAPLQCHVRLSQTGHSGFGTHRNSLVPDWLSILLLGGRNETIQTLVNSDTHSPALLNLITAKLEPLLPNSPLYSSNSQWQCVLRPTPLWGKYAEMLGLIMEPGTRLSVELRSVDALHESTPAFANLHLIPLPGFQIVVPPTLIINTDASSAQTTAYHYWITDPQKTHRRLLLFVPPVTADALTVHFAGNDRLHARSKSPDVLQVVGSPRPVSTLTEVSHILSEYEQSLITSHNQVFQLSSRVKSALGAWRVLALDQMQHVDNDAMIVSDGDSLIKRNLLWIVDLKAHLARDAINTVVDVVISLRQTTQHTTVPIHVVLPAVDDESAASALKSQSWWTLGFSWIHLFAFILFTLLIAIVGHAVSRPATLVSNAPGIGTSVSKNLPTAVAPNLISPLRTSPRKLWSQGYTISPLRGSLPSPLTASDQEGFAASTYRIRSSGSPVVSGSGDMLLQEQRWRNALSGHSPSRLRDTFDSI